jgi:hypothetical protein
MHVQFYEFRTDGTAVIFEGPVPQYSKAAAVYWARTLAELKKLHPGFHLQPVWEPSA